MQYLSYQIQSIIGNFKRVKEYFHHHNFNPKKKKLEKGKLIDDKKLYK